MDDLGVPQRNHEESMNFKPVTKATRDMKIASKATEQVSENNRILAHAQSLLFAHILTPNNCSQAPHGQTQTRKPLTKKQPLQQYTNVAQACWKNFHNRYKTQQQKPNANYQGANGMGKTLR